MNVYQAVVAITIPSVTIIGIVGLLILLRKFTNDERMAMIEKGWTLPESKSTKINPASALRWGCLFVGVGLGILVANFIASVKSESEALYPAFILFFGGFGLLISYFVQMKIDEKDK